MFTCVLKAIQRALKGRLKVGSFKAIERAFKNTLKGISEDSLKTLENGVQGPFMHFEWCSEYLIKC